MENHNIDENLGAASLKADQLFYEYPNEAVLPEHLFLAIIDSKSKILEDLLKSLFLRAAQLEGELIRYLSNNSFKQTPKKKDLVWHEHTNFIVQDAQTVMEELGDNYLGVEHILCSLARVKGTPSYQFLSKLGLKSDLIAKAILLVRGRYSGKSTRGVLKTTVNLADSNGSEKRARSKILAQSELGTDLTKLAEQGLLDPVIGRDKEIRRILNILTRRSKNNPLLLGEAGVGKTAIAEGLALKIVAGDVPMSLRGYRILSIDIGSLVADTGVRGEFEKRVNNLIEEAMSAAKNIILFIDELHLLIGAGATGDSALDAGNILKPYLARGLIRCIGATTYSEYSKHIEKDPALARRFQKIIVAEPTVPESISILRGLRDKFEGFHGVNIKDSALVSAAEMSNRFITDRQLPDKAVDIVDEAASKKRMEIDSVPKSLDEVSQKLIHLELEKASLTKDTKDLKSSKLESLSKQISKLEEESKKILKDWNQTRDELNNLSLLKQRIENLKSVISLATKESDYRLAAEIEHIELAPLAEKLSNIEQNKSEGSRNYDSVTSQDIARVVSELTGIPIARLEGDQSKSILTLESEINKRVIGQEAAVKVVSKAVKISRSNLGDPEKPIGSFMFLGPTGVGKTELAKAVSDILFNSSSNLIRLDMSEYFDKYTVARLIGAAPGYVGFDDGGQLTEAVKNKPYSCILFDEIEKAHSDIYNILLQILDEGRLTDSKGRTVDFTNTVIILTSNVCADKINDKFKESHALEKVSKSNPKQSLGIEPQGIDSLGQEFRNELEKTFRPELLNRIDEIVLFNPLSKKNIEKIITIEIEKLNSRLSKNGKQLNLSEKAMGYLASKIGQSDYGARPVGRLVKSAIQAPLSELLLEGKFKRSKNIYVDYANKELEFSSKKYSTK